MVRLIDGAGEARNLHETENKTALDKKIAGTRSGLRLETGRAPCSGRIACYLLLSRTFECVLLCQQMFMCQCTDF